MSEKDKVNWINISDEFNETDARDKNKAAEFNFIDLFAGAGGLSCGLISAGFKNIAAVEINESAVATYNRNFKANIIPRDIRNDNERAALIKEVGGVRINLISGGFPCQGFSVAGKRSADDERNSLYLEMFKLVEEIKPDFVLMENVEGLRSMLGGEIERRILNDYRNIGYDITVTVLNSADYGVPQIRKRVIFIGNRIGAVNLFPSPILTPDKYKTVKDGIARFMNKPEDKSINHIFSKHDENMIKRLAELPEGRSLYGNYADAWRKVKWNEPSITVKENHGGVNVHPKFPRVMTPRELAALQSFPDDFIFEGTKSRQLVQIGNAVPPLLGKAIGVAIIKSLKGERGAVSAACQSTFFDYEREGVYV